MILRRLLLVPATVVTVALAAASTAAAADPTPDPTSTPTSTTTPAPTDPTSIGTPDPSAPAPAPAPVQITPTVPVGPPATPLGVPVPVQKALSALQKQGAGLVTQLATLQAQAATALAGYDQTTKAVQTELDGVTALQARVDQTAADVDRTRLHFFDVARDAYVQNMPHISSSTLLIAGGKNFDDLNFKVAALSYLAGQDDRSLVSLRQAQAAAAAAVAAQQSALAAARALQATADQQRTAALTALGQVSATAGGYQSGIKDLQETAADALANPALTDADRAAWTAVQSALTALAAVSPAGTQYVVGGPGLAPLPGTSWVAPLQTYTISSCYCVRGAEFHHGVDLAAPYGTPIYAVGAGTVVAAGPAQGFGNWVVIDHHDGSYSIYGHERILATVVGTQVGPGTLIGYVGSEGESTGPHLHFEVRIGGYGSPSMSTDPVLWLAQRGVTLS